MLPALLVIPISAIVHMLHYTHIVHNSNSQFIMNGAANKFNLIQKSGNVE